MFFFNNQKLRVKQHENVLRSSATMLAWKCAKFGSYSTLILVFFLRRFFWCFFLKKWWFEICFLFCIFSLIWGELPILTTYLSNGLVKNHHYKRVVVCDLDDDDWKHHCSRNFPHVADGFHQGSDHQGKIDWKKVPPGMSCTGCNWIISPLYT